MTQTKELAKPGQYLTFVLKNQVYGVPIAAIREINRVSDITPVPQTPPYMAGVVNLRGKVIPVINLRLKFGMEFTPFTKNTCIIVIECPIGQMGTVVDSVSSVIELSAENIEPCPEMGDEEHLAFVTGMGKIDKQVVILLDIVHALSEERGVLAQMPAQTAAHLV